MTAVIKEIGRGGGYSPHILVGMCRGNVKNGGLRSELERERESGGGGGGGSPVGN